MELHDNPGAFGGLPEAPELASARFAVLPIPYEGTVTWLKGTGRGPDAILAASANMELYDIETGSEPWTHGIVTMAPVPPAETAEANYERILARAEPLYAMGKAVVGLGGEHSVTAGLVEAARRVYPGLTVLQLDAHADTRETYGGTPYNHACVMARVREQCDIVQVGIRSMDAAEAGAIRRSRIHYAHEIGDIAALSEAVLERLGDQVYITIDLDVLDPSEMPSTGTPEPGGLHYRQIVDLLREVCRWRQVVGFDIVELMPSENNRAPDFLAARLAYQIMAYMTAFAAE